MDALWYFWTLKSVCLRTWVHAVCPDVKDHVKYPVDRWGSLHREAENLGGMHRLWHGESGRSLDLAATWNRMTGLVLQEEQCPIFSSPIPHVRQNHLSLL